MTVIHIPEAWFKTCSRLNGGHQKKDAVHWEPVNVIFFGKTALANAIDDLEIRSSWIMVGPKSNTSIFINRVIAFDLNKCQRSVNALYLNYSSFPSLNSMTLFHSSYQ